MPKQAVDQAPVVRQFEYRGYTITVTLGDDGWTHTVKAEGDCRAFGSSTPLSLKETVDDAKALIDELIEHPERFDPKTPEEDEPQGARSTGTFRTTAARAARRSMTMTTTEQHRPGGPLRESAGPVSPTV